VLKRNFYYNLRDICSQYLLLIGSLLCYPPSAPSSFCPPPSLSPDGRIFDPITFEDLKKLSIAGKIGGIRIQSKTSRSDRKCPDPNKNVRIRPKNVRIRPKMSGSDRKCPDPTKNVRIRPKMSGSDRKCPDPTENVRIRPKMSRSDQKCPDPTKNVWIRPKMSGSN
jgi:hypothetical protein